MSEILFGELFEEKIDELYNAIDVVTKFNLYRRGKLDISMCPEPKEIGDALDTLLGIAIEYEELARNNVALREIINENETKKKEEDSKSEIEKMLQKVQEKKAEEKLQPINVHKHNGENDEQCIGCGDYDKNGICRWGECMWYTRRPMAFDFRVCCETCAFQDENDGKCTYLKEQDKREIECKKRQAERKGKKK